MMLIEAFCLYIYRDTLHIFIHLKLSTHPRRAVATHRTVLKLLMIQTLIFASCHPAVPLVLEDGEGVAGNSLLLCPTLFSYFTSSKNFDI